MTNQKEKPTTPTTPIMSIILPDNCFGIGPYWSPQVWAAFFVDHRTAAFLEYQEHGPRIFVEWAKKGEASTLTLGWCPPGSWVPTKLLPPVPCSDVKATLHAGGVGDPEEEWAYELRALLTAHVYSVDPLESLRAWAAYMFMRAHKAGVDVGWVGAETEPEPEPEVEEPDAVKPKQFVIFHWDAVAADPTWARKALSYCGISEEGIHIFGRCMDGRSYTDGRSLVLRFLDGGCAVELGWYAAGGPYCFAENPIKLPNDNLQILGDLAPLGLGLPWDQAPPLVRLLFSGVKRDPADVQRILEVMADALRTGKSLPAPEPEPEPAEPAEPAESEPPLAPLPRGYEWELNLSSKETGRLDGCVTIFRQNKVCEESPRSAREKLCLTFKLDNEDLRAHARLLRSLMKSGTFEQALGQLLNFARNE